MASDQRFRDLLEAALPPEEDRAQARHEIGRRVAAARRRRRTTRVAGTAAAAAAVLVGVLVVPDIVAPPRVPEIGRDAGDVTVSTDCGDYDLPPSLAEYVERWTEGGRVHGEVCVLTAVDAPEPRFDVSGLGEEQAWLDDDLSRGVVTPPERLATPGYPVVHVGTIAMPVDELRLRALRSWIEAVDGSLSWCTSTAQGGGCGRGESGEVGLSSGPVGKSLELLVPAETAVAALALDGEPVMWQRPRGRSAVFSPAAGGSRYTVTAYDASGEVLAEYTGRTT